MNKNELTEYRNALSKEFVDKDLEIENSLSYISAGALGFFITINDKFLKIKEANCKLLIIISLCLIFVSFILILIRKSRTRSHAYKMIRFVDKMKPESYDDDVNLSDLWKESHKELNCIRLWVYITLGTGIGLQILFLSLNYF